MQHYCLEVFVVENGLVLWVAPQTVKSDAVTFRTSQNEALKSGGETPGGFFINSSVKHVIDKNFLQIIATFLWIYNQTGVVGT